MSNTTDYLKDIAEIRSMMERSSRFLSLSGISGILAGIYALAGAFFAYQLIYSQQQNFGYRTVDLGTVDTVKWLLIDGIVVLVLSLATAGILSWRRSKKLKQKLWNKQARLLLLHMMIPLVTGGLLCLILITKGYAGVVAPLTLIFYGLAIVNSSKYTYSMMQYLGYMEIVLGLLSAAFIGYGLFFWTIGFGLLHILYGAVMYFKYERASAPVEDK